jgi:hypothetical protein
MKKLIEDTGSKVSVRARPDDAVARLRRQRGSIRERVTKAQRLTDDERDLLLVAIAQRLGIF